MRDRPLNSEGLSRLRLRVGRGTTRAEDAQGTLTQSHISPGVLVNEENLKSELGRFGLYVRVGEYRAG